MAKKFVKHTGIESRRISRENEIQLAIRAIRNLQEKSGCDLTSCAGLVLVSPSLIPLNIARKHLPADEARREQPTRLAREIARGLAIRPRLTLGINGFCSGYAKAMQLTRQRVADRLALSESEFTIVVTASRISRITDFGCRQSGALFGDFATATLISHSENRRHPIRFELIDARYERQPASRPFFDFQLKRDVLIPADDGTQTRVASRLVFSLDGMGIADTAPRAMAAAAASMARDNSLDPDTIDHIVPHQAGAGIVRLTAMKLEEAGFVADPLNGLTENFGNVSSCSVPLALERNWQQLQGTILCPVAAVGAPGRAEVSQGCILLKSMDQRQSRAA
jgi:3-oxoacyl-[acyl-carrier-protein] synthase III